MMDFASMIVLQIAEKLREISTRQGMVPFLTGDLRKSIQAHLVAPGRAVVGSNLSYARAVHDGRPAMTIRPRKKKALFWPGAAHPVKSVRQGERKGKPFFLWAKRKLEAEGYDFVYPTLMRHVEEEVARHIVKSIKIDIRL